MSALTVRRLITQLRKMPQSATIAVCDHDQDPDSGEFNGSVNRVEVAPQALKERGYGVIILL